MLDKYGPRFIPDVAVIGWPASLSVREIVCLIGSGLVGLVIAC